MRQGTGAQEPTTSRSDEDLAVDAGHGDEAARNELLHRFAPTIQAKARAYARAPIPLTAIEGEGMKILLFAAQKFQPSAGVKFKTFLDTYLKGLYRYVAKNQNVARIPEHQVREITRYKNTKEILRVQKNREPTHEEMGDALGWAPSQAQRLETSLSRRDIAASGLPTSPEVLRINEKMEEVLEFEYFSRMTPKEKLVYDYSLGKHGRPRLDTVKAIAAKTGLTEGDVYAVKRSLAQRVMGQL